MKRKIFVFAILIFLLSTPVFAQGENPFGNTQDYLPSEVYDYITEEEVVRLEKAELDPTFFFSRLTSLWNALAPTLTASFLKMLGILLFFAAFRILQKKESSASMVSALTLSLYAYAALLPVFRQCQAAIDSLHRLMNALTPTVTSLYLLGGSTTTAGVQGSLFTWFLAVMQQTVSSLFVPMAQALLGLILLGRFCENHLFFLLAQRIRRALTWGVGLFFGIFGLVMGVQSSIAQASDRLAAKGLKFAFGTFLPYAGGALAESVRALMGGLSVLKSSAGAVGIFCVFAIVAPPLVALLCQMLFFSLSALFAEWVGCEREGIFLTQIGEVLKFMLLFLVALSLFFIFFLILFANSAAAYSA